MIQKMSTVMLLSVYSVVIQVGVLSAQPGWLNLTEAQWRSCRDQFNGERFVDSSEPSNINGWLARTKVTHGRDGETTRHICVADRWIEIGQSGEVEHQVGSHWYTGEDFKPTSVELSEDLTEIKIVASKRIRDFYDQQKVSKSFEIKTEWRLRAADMASERSSFYLRFSAWAEAAWGSAGNLDQPQGFFFVIDPGRNLTADHAMKYLSTERLRLMVANSPYANESILKSIVRWVNQQLGPSERATLLLEHPAGNLPLDYFKVKLTVVTGFPIYLQSLLREIVIPLSVIQREY